MLTVYRPRSGFYRAQAAALRSLQGRLPPEEEARLTREARRDGWEAFREEAEWTMVGTNAIYGGLSYGELPQAWRGVVERNEGDDRRARGDSAGC